MSKTAITNFIRLSRLRPLSVLNKHRRKTYPAVTMLTMLEQTSVAPKKTVVIKTKNYQTFGIHDSKSPKHKSA